jgi:hypothetical protein
MMISSQEWIRTTRGTQTLIPKNLMKTTTTMKALAPARVMTMLDNVSLSDDDEVLDDVSLSEEDVNEDVPTSIKKLSDDTRALPPIIQSRTRQQARETGESLMTGAEAIKTVTKKQRKFRKELQIRLLKREEEENTKKLRNKLRNLKK